jgi:hypothetical protein
MKTFNNFEDAYREIGKSIIDFIEGRQWDEGCFHCVIYPKSAHASWSFNYRGEKNTKALGWGDESIDATGAAFFLRDEMLKTTGNRIWAMTALLYPNNEIKITYDYDKPKDYVEPSENDEPVNVFESIERMNAAGAHFGGVTETRPKDKDGK